MPGAVIRQPPSSRYITTCSSSPPCGSYHGLAHLPIDHTHPPTPPSTTSVPHSGSSSTNEVEHILVLVDELDYLRTPSVTMCRPNLLFRFGPTTILYSLLDYHPTLLTAYIAFGLLQLGGPLAVQPFQLAHADWVKAYGELSITPA